MRTIMGRSLISSFHTSARSAFARWCGLRTVSTVISATLVAISVFFTFSPSSYCSFSCFVGVAAIILACLSATRSAIKCWMWRAS